MVETFAKESESRNKGIVQEVIDKEEDDERTPIEPEEVFTVNTTAITITYFIGSMVSVLLFICEHWGYVRWRFSYVIFLPFIPCFIAMVIVSSRKKSNDSSSSLLDRTDKVKKD
jgi:hypothetical protein